MSNRFPVYTQDGREFWVREIRSRIPITTLEGRSSIEGIARLELEREGTPLNFIDDNTFKNPITEEILTRKKPQS